MRLRTILEQNGKTATGIRVPPELVEGLGRGKRPPVRVTINGYTYRSTVSVMGGTYLLSVSAENREAAGIVAGQEIDVDVEPDTEPREVVVPPDLAMALDNVPEARRYFDGLSYSNKLRQVLSIEAAKNEATRQRRIGNAVAMLKQGGV